MKKLFISMLAVAALASCSKEQTIVADKGELIGFNSFVENSTRADDPSYSANDIESFTLYGTVGNVVIYPGTTVTKTTYGSAWTCPVDQYWIAGANYKFVGIVDGSVEGVTETNLDGGMPTSVEYTADGATDLLCQTITKTANTDGTENGLVAFNFKHLLSKVNFTVNNDSKDADGYSFVVKNITFNGATKATYNVVSAAWESASVTGNTVVGNERTITVDGTEKTVKDIVVASKAESNELATELLFIPGQYTITFTVDILCKGEVITTTNYPTTGSYSATLDAAKAYNFNVNVSVGDKIKFTVTQQPTWTDGDGVNDTTLTL